MISERTNTLTQIEDIVYILLIGWALDLQIHHCILIINGKAEHTYWFGLFYYVNMFNGVRLDDTWLEWDLFTGCWHWQRILKQHKLHTMFYHRASQILESIHTGNQAAQYGCTTNNILVLVPFTYKWKLFFFKQTPTDA